MADSHHRQQSTSTKMNTKDNQNPDLILGTEFGKRQILTREHAHVCFEKPALCLLTAFSTVSLTSMRPSIAIRNMHI
jgi:hypothetical protein